MGVETAAAWRLRTTLPAAAVPTFEAALTGLGAAIVVDGPDGADQVPFEAYLAAKPDRAALTARLAAAALAAGVEPPEYALEALPKRDWVAEGQKALPAIHIGPFFLYGAHVTEPPPTGSIALRIEAGLAFGTGRHESTRGCLTALADLARQAEVRVGQALDMGCGSGILALAVARLWDCPVLGVDNDANAVQVARENAALNGAPEIAFALGEGYHCAEVMRRRPFDLIVANILAEPLCAMAPGLLESLSPGGRAILSGLLAEEADEVLAAHRPLRPLNRYVFDDWVTLVLGA
ncbi:MAG TPA: 50S ribosomal protein L11 methyltransferase [Kiloniellales bacterium]|nr:50S ribosomal protein L11 methyltransferase [Kiloniellales bacterium]